MTNPTRDFALGLLLATSLTAGLSYGQDVLPTNPTPVMPASARIDVPTAPPSAAMTPVLETPLPSRALLPPQLTPSFFPSGEYQPPKPEAGLFLGVEADLLVPHVKNRLIAPVTFYDGGMDTVHVPQAQLDWVVSPKFDLGYRLEDDMGALVASYRFLTSVGYDTIANFDTAGDGALRSRLDVQVVDLDYVSNYLPLFSKLEAHWRLGARISTVYFDSEAVGGVADVKTANHFVGAGPHGGVDAWYQLGEGFALFGKVDVATLIGQVHQSLGENFLLDDGTLYGAVTDVARTRAVPVMSVQLGFGWSPRFGADRWHFSTGYEFEQWWMLGDIDASRAELTSQGLFFRGEFNF